MGNKKVNINIEDWDSTCGDGCCTMFGTTVNVDGVELECQNEDRETIITKILEHLGYEVEMTYWKRRKMITNKRRTGRTTHLILNAIQEVLKLGFVVFIDHPREDGKMIPTEHYLDIEKKFRKILTVLFNGIPSDEIFSFEQQHDGLGMIIRNKYF